MPQDRAVQGNDQNLLLVIDKELQQAQSLQEQIEFMDTPNVEATVPADWQSVMDFGRVTAIFLGSNLANEELDRVISEIGNLDPNVPIVLVKKESNA